MGGRAYMSVHERMRLGGYMAPETSDNWKPEAVLAELRKQAQGSGTAAAQVFLVGSETGTDIADTVHSAVRDAARDAGSQSSPPSIGRISTLAKSFSLVAEPAVFSALARHPKVKSILPSAIEDIYPKPVRRTTNSKP